ncbi:glycosyltransferase [Acholeplasma equifetale]|uniref:glycosyltransferase n=1 Tax=Acholeplasma equifetale TaxID=264634 RepID=UPI00138AB55B|nr:glycosyltransferase [Acholeplasma equifetale]
MEKFSVLMSVYYKEKASNLSEALDSILNQTIIPDEILIVEDGPLTEELSMVISKYTKKYNIIRTFKINENVGLGLALQKGLLECSNEIIARMDSDDISVPDRFEKQLKYLLKNPNISVVGSHIVEFLSDTKEEAARRIVPLYDSDIKKMIKRRNPFNHPSVMFKKSEVIKSGNYQDSYLNEDYFLWIRMMQIGCKFANIDHFLVKMRINNDTYIRRGGYKYFKTQQQIFKYMRKKKIINYYEYLYQTFLRFIIRVLVPNSIRKFIYQKFLRKSE